MKINSQKHRWAGLALAVAAALAAPSAFAATVTLTDQSSGDLFLGFRQSGNAQDVEVDLGSVAKYTPVALGGTWTGSSFNITFGVIPGSPTAVTDIFADLSAVFGNTWYANTGDQTGVRWAVAGNQSASSSPLSINPGKNTVFLTRAETTIDQQSAAPGVGAIDYGSASGAIKQIESSSGYAGRQSTANSSVVLIESSALTASWNTQIGPITSGSGFSSGIPVEQALGGLLSGPVDSKLDLYLISNDSANGVSNAGTYLGSFSLNSSGQLTYGSVAASVPEPSGGIFLALGATMLGMVRRRRSAEKILNPVTSL